MKTSTRFLRVCLATAIWLGAFYRVPVSAQTVSAPSADTLAIHHINVGNGDATLITFSGKASLLVDGGDGDTGGKNVIALLRHEKISSLDYAIYTHDDPEHTDGLDQTLRAVKCKNVIDGRKAGAGLGSPFALGTAQVEVLAVNGKVKGGASALGASPNSRSVALLVTYGKFRYFLGGDLSGGGKSGLARTLDLETLVAAEAGQVDVLRVNHHGSGTSSNAAFLAALNPQAAIISVGNGGRNLALYNFPSRRVLDRLLALPQLRHVYLTNQGETLGGLTATDKKKIETANGDILVSTDGSANFRIGKDEYQFRDGGQGKD